MEIDALINVLLSMGVPGVLIAILIFFLYKYAPRFIDAYKKAKESEQQAFADRQREYREQSERIVEVATKSALAVENNSNALERNSAIHQKVIAAFEKTEAALTGLLESFKAHDKRTEDMNVDVKRILENARKGAAE